MSVWLPTRRLRHGGTCTLTWCAQRQLCDPAPFSTQHSQTCFQAHGSRCQAEAATALVSGHPHSWAPGLLDTPDTPWSVMQAQGANPGNGWAALTGVNFTAQHQPATIDFAAFHYWPDLWVSCSALGCCLIVQQDPLVSALLLNSC